MSDNELYHYGILGMKWGVRRFQNKDGTRTAAGKKRYSSRDNPGEQTKPKTVAERKKEILASRSARMLYDNADLFTDSELQSAYNRLNLERNIKSLTPNEISKGKAMVKKVADTTVKISAVMTTGIALWNNGAKIYNTFSKNGKENPLPLIGGKEKKKKSDD